MPSGANCLAAAKTVPSPPNIIARSIFSETEERKTG